MGSYTVRKLTLLMFFVFGCLAWPGLALAQEPQPTPDTGYHFDPLDIPAAPYDIPLGDFTSSDFINNVGSYALTVLVLLDSYSVLGKFVVILLGFSMIWWVYGFVTKRRKLPKVTNDNDDDEVDNTPRRYPINYY